MIDMLRTLLVIALTLESIGVAVSVLLILDARHDLDAIELHNIGNGRKVVAQSALLTEKFRLAALVFLLLSSSASTATLWNVRAAAVTMMLLFAMWMFFFGAAAIVAQSLTVYRTRRKLFDGYRRKHEQIRSLRD